ncbi:hypothetical protein BKA67DRAFT_564427 [Truncatella angustata]|uniref:Glucose-methanol-choline oxidoreductase N-terminal domain-containing protein n=1 Tax=Truncatella angustata TaxID=152316 RepID=A0A9P8UL50_9PEZI|nr:uncharacterized protein BKA67DRAFT_564427 [Truncatella angustata]KAH6654209.1 hypothetical protein BKA67DRAFT_564427 [Truncatella angustata]
MFGLLILTFVALSIAVSNQSYDFIVVGGGTAGLAVAVRLSQKLPDLSVLVIEAGPDGRDIPGIYVPGRKGSLLGTIYDWNFTTVPQPGANNRILSQNRGRVLGGSSALNLISWDRGAKADYDDWESFGNPGWNWDSMHSAMRKSETFQLTPNNGSAGIKGVGDHGEIRSLISRFSTPQNEEFFPAMHNLGYGQTYGYMDGEVLGYMRHTSNVLLSNYTRSYSPAYLAVAGSNLHLMLNTTVSKVTLDNERRATGVMMEDGTTITATKEVILSAGSIQSPQLLELSGVGNATVLSSAGITPVVELPGVGENLQDHVRIVNVYQLDSNYTSADILRFNATFAAEQLDRWERNITGFYDNTGSAYAYLTWQQALGNDSTFKELARQAASPHIVDQRKLENVLDVNKGVPQVEVLFSDGYLGLKGYPVANSSLYGQTFFAMIASIQHPFSRGSVHLNTSHPSGKPILNPNYLSNEYDLQAVKEAAKFLRKVATTPPLSYTWVDEYEPGFEISTDAQWTEYAKSHALSIWHPVGTCAMLPKEEGGVVDSHLRVYGVPNLRIVDASIMPALVSGHIQSAVYGIAERAADLISGAWS